VLGLLNSLPGLTPGSVAAQEAAVQAEATVEAVPLVPGQGDDELGVPELAAGFQLPLVDEDERELLNKLGERLDERDWANAFRVLTELDADQMQAIAPRGDSPVYAPIRGQVQRRLLALDPEGLRAFRLYFDAQANELYEQFKNHPLPGSYDALSRLQSLLDRFYATSIGGRAAALAGDMYFERGLFARAERSWRMAVEHDQTAGADRTQLQAKRVIALTRGGDDEAARQLAEQLLARYDKLPLAIGGESIDGLALLDRLLEDASPEAAPPATAATEPTLPAEDALPAWHLTFLDPASRSRAAAGNRNSYYRTPDDLKHFVPEVVADDQRVYFAWLEACFALDRQTGKMLWRSGSVRAVSEQLPQRITTNAGDPRNYNIALAGQTLLLTEPSTQGQDTAFSLVGLDTRTGQRRWSTAQRRDWRLGEDGDAGKRVSILGEIAIAHDAAYAMLHRVGESDCYLRRFNPETGEIDWTLKLGAADRIGFRYTQVNRMPQPRLLASDDLLHVLVGGGMLITVDATAGQIAWALRMDTPLDTELARQANNSRNTLADHIDRLANPNGSGALLMHRGTLYAKQHLGDTLFALAPRTGDLAWSADRLDADAKLVGVDDQRFYLMNEAIRGYKIDGEHDLAWNNARDTGRARHAGARLGDDRLLVMGDYRLSLLENESGDVVGRFRSDDYLGPSGGNLYRFGDLLVCIDATQITAYRLSPPGNADQAERQAPPQNEQDTGT